jgi:hypothetical protein
MKVSTTSFGVLGGLAAIILVTLVIGVVDGCGNTQTPFGDDSGTSGPSSGSGGSSGGPGSSSGLGTATPDGSSNIIITLPDGAMQVVEAGGSSSGPTVPMPIGKIPAADCMGCKFPDLNAQPCSGAPAIKLVYPNDTVLLPPNMNVISVQWTPFGAPYIRYEVDFSNSPNTDWRIITACSNQTTDMQAGGTPSGGCELTIDPVSWGRLVQANRGGGPVAVTVRGTTNGTCASVSSNTVNVSWAEEDLLGTYYYWKSTVTSQGVGGQIWDKVFGDLQMQEADVTSNVATQSGTLMATCNGCHALSRDGSRMVVYSDDSDSDDEYSDVGGSLLDMTPLPNGTPTELGVGVSGSRTGGQPPGFSTLHPNATSYLSSNGLGWLTDAGAPPAGLSGGTSTSAGYTAAIPANAFSLWNGMGALTGPVTAATAPTRPTMPDWSIDGKSVVYVEPQAIASWTGTFGGTNTDDDHIFGGSLYTMPYNGNGMFGAPAVFLMSAGENNYYPSYSPDADPQNMKPPSYVLFNRVPNNSGAGTMCANGFCPNDSFSNPAARLLLMKNMAAATPIDLEKANGSPAASAIPLSNSYPRWAPFVQRYKGNPILWFTFSSTRDYGLRVLNHKQGMYQCYPADAAETPGGAHMQQFAAACQQPQLWMAPIFFTEAQNNKDPSGVAFWIPYQDIGTHNHTAQWTWKPNPPPPPPPDGGPPPCMCSATYGPCGAKNACGCCAASDKCSGDSKCISIAN